MRLAVKFCGYLWRPLTSSEADTDFVLQLRNSPQAQAAFFNSVITREGHLRFLQLAEERGEINWIVEKEGEKVGACGLYHIDHKNRRVEGGRLAVTIPDAHFLSCFVLAYVSFEVLNMNKLCAEAFSSNSTSNKSLERLGSTREGVLREHFFHQEQPMDVAVFGLLNKNWRQHKQDLYSKFGEPEILKHGSEDTW
jgi:RimJ/RimL family protein N-acetyltransferase